MSEKCSTEKLAGPAARAARIVVAVVSATTLPPDLTPRSMVIDSDDLLPPIKAPWITRHPWHVWVNSKHFAQDDPEALRASGPQAVASALAGLAEWGQAAGRQDVREVAALIRAWLESDAGRFDTLDRDLCLSPRDGRRPLADVARRAERDKLVIKLARQEPYSDMPPRPAAVALRRACEAYASNAWLRDRERLARPQGQTLWWSVLRLGLSRPMPGVDHLAQMIADDRNGRTPNEAGGTQLEARGRF